MAGGGCYPTMTDLEWRDAPWNERESKYEVCIECNGDGGIWYDEDGNEYSVADYKRMSDEMREGLEFDKCERCKGKGKVEFEPYEIDCDYYG